LAVTYSQNEEYFAIKKETLNGMVSPMAYLVAKTVIEMPMMFVLAFTSVSVSMYGMLDFDASNMFNMIIAMAILLWNFDCFAQLFAVQFSNPLLGMLQFMQMYFACFLFSEFFVPEDLVIWPFKAFIYVLPLKYATRAMIYTEFSGSATYSGAMLCQKNDTTTWNNATSCMQWPGQSQGFNCMNNGVEVDFGRGCFGVESDQVLESIGSNYRAISSKNTLATDFGIMLAIGAVFKLFFFVTFYTKCLKVTSVKDNGSTEVVKYGNVEKRLK